MQIVGYLRANIDHGKDGFKGLRRVKGSGDAQRVRAEVWIEDIHAVEVKTDIFAGEEMVFNGVDKALGSRGVGTEGEIGDFDGNGVSRAAVSGFCGRNSQCVDVGPFAGVTLTEDTVSLHRCLCIIREGVFFDRIFVGPVYDDFPSRSVCRSFKPFGDFIASAADTTVQSQFGLPKFFKGGHCARIEIELFFVFGIEVDHAAFLFAQITFYDKAGGSLSVRARLFHCRGSVLSGSGGFLGFGRGGLVWNVVPCFVVRD